MTTIASALWMSSVPLRRRLGAARNLLDDTLVRFTLRLASQIESSRGDIDPADVMFGISGVSLVAGAPKQRDQAGRLVDLLLDGLRYRPPRQESPAGG